MRWRRGREGEETASASRADDTPDAPPARDDAATVGDAAVAGADGVEGQDEPRDRSGSRTADEVAAPPTPRVAPEPRPEPPRFTLDERDLERTVRRTVARALAEDLGDRGDLTTIATVPAGLLGTAEIVVKRRGVVSGTSVFAAAFEQFDQRVEVTFDVADGNVVEPGPIGRVRGPLRSILTAERTALNLLGHLSGIASVTREFVDAVAGTACEVRDTRKTTAGLRLLEKLAVTHGGGVNHRVGLHDALLVKDNHVAAAGGVTAATRAALERAEGRPVQIEVTTLGELDEAIAAGATDVLLDNFTPTGVAEAVAHAGGRVLLEASGTIDLRTVRAYAEAGVDRVAVGRITHSAPWLDISLDVVVTEEPARAAPAAVSADDQPEASPLDEEPARDDADADDAAGATVQDAADGDGGSTPAREQPVDDEDEVHGGDDDAAMLGLALEEVLRDAGVAAEDLEEGALHDDEEPEADDDRDEHRTDAQKLDADALDDEADADGGEEEALADDRERPPPEESLFAWRDAPFVHRRDREDGSD